MALEWRAFLYDCTQNGLIQNTQEITDIINDFNLEKTVGDNLYIKSGDINLELLSPLKVSSLSHLQYKFVAIHLNGSLFDIFWVENNDGIIHAGNVYYAYDEVDEKWDRYKLRLQSIQKKLYDDLRDTGMSSSGYGAGVPTAAGLEIDTIKVNSQAGEVSDTSRWGFSLFDIVENIAGNDGNDGFTIGNITHSGKLKNENTLPIFYRSLSDDFATVSADDAFDNTFNDATAFGESMSWLQLFQIASIVTNSFIRVTPRIESDVITLDVDLIPKIAVSLGTAKQSRWYERQRLVEKFRIDGVLIESRYTDDDTNLPSFQFKQGNADGDKIFSRKAEVADPESVVPQIGVTIYLSWGDFNAGDGQYEILDGGGNYRPYFDSGDVEPFYADMISGGDGYKGEIFYQGEKILDQVLFGQIKIHLNRIKISRRGRVNIEGIKIA